MGGGGREKMVKNTQLQSNYLRLVAAYIADGSTPLTKIEFEMSAKFYGQTDIIVWVL